MSPSASSLPRLRRILAMVPWVIARGGAGVEEVCVRFGITREQLGKDLNLLLVCGLPPFGPGDLIDAQIESDRVVITMADYLAHPLRLTRWEGLSLLVAGRAVAALPGLEETASLGGALEKLASAMAPAEAEAAAKLAERVAVDLEPVSEELLATLGGAIAKRRQVRIEYYSFGRDAMSERTVNPWVVFGAGRRWYVAGLDQSSGEERSFRVDRIRSAEVLGSEFQVPEGFDPAVYTRGALFRPSKDDLEVTIELAPSAAWVREVTPHESDEVLGDGWVRIRLRTQHLAWLARLVLQLGPKVRIVSPAELTREVRDAARRTLALYEPGT